MRKLMLWLMAVLAVLGVAATARADHIRVMVVQQDPTFTGTTVKLRVDYNYSGNCCGGVFNWTTGDSYGRVGALADGISGGAYQGDASGTGTFSWAATPPTGIQQFSWTRFRPNPAIMMVRIEITYTYQQAGTYSVTWNDCCPASSGGTTLVAVAGQSAPTVRVLTFDQVGSTTWTDALEQQGIQSCALTAPVPVCYDEVNPVTFLPITAAQTQSYLRDYKVLFVGRNANAATLNLLNTRAQGISLWAQGDRGGIVAYAQSGVNGFGWLPNLPGSPVTVTAPPVAGNTQYADLTPRGLAHSSHRNQLPAVGVPNAVGSAPSTLANWGPSVQHAFTAWPVYFNSSTGLGAALAVDAGGSAGRALSLAGSISPDPATSGCAFISGQPIDERAVAGVLAAQQMVRSTINYAISCDATALGVL